MKRPLKILASLTSASALVGSQFLLPLPPAKAQTFINNAGCPVGTTESPTNRVTNGNFSTNSGITGPGNPPTAVAPFPVPAGLGFQSDLPYRGDRAYPDDGNGGGLSIQNGVLTDPNTPAVVNGRGVTAAEAAQVGIDPAPINTYLYSNPFNNNAGQPVVIPPAPAGTPPPIVWRQTLTVNPNTVYNFKALFFNLLRNDGVPGSNGVPPEIRLESGPPGAAGTGALNPTLRVGDPAAPVPGFPGITNVRQAWIPVQFAFRTNPGQNQIELRIVDLAQNSFGDDFGVTAVGLRECIPVIGVSKNAGTPIDNGNGTFTVPYTVVVRNFAPAGTPAVYDLLNLQLADNLSQTFASASSFQVQPGSIQSPTLTVNPNFSGIPNGANPAANSLLLGTDTLAAGTTATVTFNVILTPGTGSNGFGPFQNQVRATATSRGGSPVDANSNNGVNPDLNGNGLPDPPSPTLVSLPRPNIPGVGNQRFRLVKRITNATRNGAPIPGVDFGSVVNDPSSTDDDAPGWAQFPPVGVITIPPSNPLQSGDEVTYTVYFLSDGDTTVRNTNVCDPIPTSTTFVSGSTQIQRPSTSLSPGGAFFPPLAPLPPDNSCTSQTNTNGSVIYDVGDVSNAPGSNFGLVRFKVRIN